MRQTTSTTSTMTRTPTRASCTTCEHALRARSFRLSFDVCVTCTSWLKVFLSLISSTFIVIHERFSSSSFSNLYFDLSFTILFHIFLLMHLEQHTQLDNLITMQNLRTSANKGSNDANDVHTSLTLLVRFVKSGVLELQLELYPFWFQRVIWRTASTAA